MVDELSKRLKSLRGRRFRPLTRCKTTVFIELKGDWRPPHGQLGRAPHTGYG
jgi:hypothetical protein